MRQDSPLLFLEGALLITNPRGELLLDKVSRCTCCNEALLRTPELPLNCGSLNTPDRQTPAWINVYRHTMNEMVKLLIQTRSCHQTSHPYHICQGYLAALYAVSRMISTRPEQQGYGPDMWVWRQLCHGAWISLQWAFSIGDPLGQESWLGHSQWELCWEEQLL